MPMHSFLSNPNRVDMCQTCGRHAIDHSDKAECDICGRLPTDSEKRHEMLLGKVLCAEHYKAAMEENRKVTTVVNQNKVNGNISGIGDVTVKEELFNARTSALVEVKERMLAEGKSPYEFCKWMESQLVAAKENLIRIKKEEEKEVSSIRAIQVQFNALADKLTKEQRDSLALKDINYKPVQVKVSTPKVSNPKKRSETVEFMNQLKAVASEIGAPIEVLKTLANMRQLTAEQTKQAYLEITGKGK